MNETIIQPQTWAPPPVQYDNTGRHSRGQNIQGFAAIIILGLMLTALVCFCLAACHETRRRRLEDSIEEDKKDAIRKRIQNAMTNQDVTMVVKPEHLQVQPSIPAATDSDDVESSRQLDEKDVETVVGVEENNNKLILPCRTESDSPRFVSATCAICLDEYKEGELIVWASNAECIHCFHKECFAEAFTARPSKDEKSNETASITRWPCPICRQCFLSTDTIQPATTNIGSTAKAGSDDSSIQV